MGQNGRRQNGRGQDGRGQNGSQQWLTKWLLYPKQLLYPQTALAEEWLPRRAISAAPIRSWQLNNTAAAGNFYLQIRDRLTQLTPNEPEQTNVANTQLGPLEDDYGSSPLLVF
jgi:hypothetical protein